MRFFTTLLVLALAVPAFAQVTKQERAGIVNFSKVDAVVACGGATETSALDGLKADGIKAIINLRTAGEQDANLEQNAARAKELGPEVHQHSVRCAAAGSESCRSVPAAIANNEQLSRGSCTAESASRVGALWLLKRVMQD